MKTSQGNAKAYLGFAIVCPMGHSLGLYTPAEAQRKQGRQMRCYECRDSFELAKVPNAK